MNSNYKKNVIYKEVLAKFAEDGAVCSYDTRDYDERETALGGNSFRKQFTDINDKITRYHALLEVLTGEKRANITESIPVIDFIDKSNIGFDKYYTNDEYDSIEELPSSSYSTLNMLINGDKHFINRALLGQDQKLHFFNTTADIGNINNILVSDCSLKGRELLYKGSKGQKYINTTIGNTNPITVKSFVNLENLICVSVDKSNKDREEYLNSFEEELEDNETVELKHELYAKIVSTPTDEDKADIKLCYDPTSPSDEKAYFLNSYVILEDNLTFTQWLTKLDPDYKKFLKDITGNSTISDSEIWNAILAKDKVTIPLEEGDIVFVIQASPSSTIENNKVLLFRKFTTDGLDFYKVFSLIVEDFSFSKGVSVDEIPYNSTISKELEDYILVPFITGYNKTTADKETHIIDTLTFLKRFLFLDDVYTAPASGLLLGKFCEPIIQEGSSILGMGTGKTTSKWKFYNNGSLYYKYHKDSNDYNVGTIFTNENIFCRGSFRESPLKLTAKMSADLNNNTDGINGYASYLYKKIENLTDATVLLEGKFVDVNKDSWWTNLENKPALDSVITLEGTRPSKSSKAEEEGLNLIHIDKFTSLGRDINLADIEKALKTWFKVPTLNKDRFVKVDDNYMKNHVDTWKWVSESKRRELIIDGLYVLNIDARATQDTAVDTDDADRFWFLFIPITSGRDYPNYYKNNYLPAMLTDFKYLWQATYTTLRHTFLGIPISTDYFNRLKINGISPMELCTRGCDTDARTILLYPSEKDKLAERLYLFSKDDLHFEAGNVCTFWNAEKGGLVSFKISKVYEYLPSKVRCVSIRDNQASETNDVGYYDVTHVPTGKFDSDGNEITEEKVEFIYRTGESHQTFSIEFLKDKDCWVYALEPVELKLKNFTYVDMDDVIQTQDEILLDLKPMAYPQNYFKCVSNGESLVLANPDSVSNLKGSVFLKGIPAKFENGKIIKDKSFYSNLKVNGRNLEIFWDFMFSGESTFSRISQRLLQVMLSDVLSNCSLVKSE